MVTVNIGYDGENYSLTMFGHANEGEGSPEVCAACSAIVYALAGWAENNKDHIMGTEQSICESGNFVLVIKGDKSCAVAWDMATIGLLQIAAEYPKQVLVLSVKF